MIKQTLTGWLSAASTISLCAVLTTAAADPPETEEEKWRIGVMYVTVDPETGGATQSYCAAVPATTTLAVVLSSCRVTITPRLTFVAPRGVEHWTPVQRELEYTSEETGMCAVTILRLGTPLPSDYPRESLVNACKNEV